MTEEHRNELLDMVQRLREIAEHQPSGRRLAMHAIATHIEYGPARAPVAERMGPEDQDQHTQACIPLKH